MPSYRAYRLDDARRIITADWIEADDDDEARAEAQENLCNDGIPAVELWEATRFVDEIECDEGEGGEA